MDPLFKCKEQKAYGSSRLEDQRQSSSPLGRIVKVYSGKDSKVRVQKVQAPGQEICQKMGALYINKNSEHQLKQSDDCHAVRRK